MASTLPFKILSETVWCTIKILLVDFNPHFINKNNRKKTGRFIPKPTR